MTIRENTIKLKDNKLTFSNNKTPLLSNMGLTKEQILLKDIKILANELLNVLKSCIRELKEEYLK